MSLPAFPNIQQPSYPLSSQVENPAMSSKMENGIVISRPRFTRMRETFNLRWSAMPAADYYTLRTFWKDEALGGSHEFNWTYPNVPNDPYSGRVFTVRFTNSELKFDLAGPGFYSGDLTIQEV